MTLFAPERRVRLGDFGKGLLVAAAFALGSTAIGLTIAEPVATTLPLAVWLAFLVPLVGLVFLQATAEELIFRGYLLQQLALRSRSPLVWAVLPSAAFGALALDGRAAGRGVGLLCPDHLPDGAGARCARLAHRQPVGRDRRACRLQRHRPDGGRRRGLAVRAQLFLFSDDDLLPLMRVDLGATAALLAFVLSPWAPFGRVFVLTDSPPRRADA